MFIFESYLKKPTIKIWDIEDLNKNPKKYYLCVNDNESIVEILDQFDPKYIDGVICIKYNDIAIMDYRYWDTVDDLWTYLLNLLGDYLENGEAQIYFPDQPILLRLSSINKDLVLFSIQNFDDKKLSLPKREFFTAILDYGEAFFESMQEYFGDQVNYDYPREKISELRELID